MQSPNDFKNFVFFDSKILALSSSTQSRPNILRKPIGILVIVAERKVDTTISVQVTFI